MKLFKNRTITTIHIWGMGIMLLFVVLFVALVIYEEYRDFDREASVLRKHYIQEQKDHIVFDIDRVLGFIEHEYASQRRKVEKKRLQMQILDAIEHLYGRQDGTGYIFIYRDDGTKLSDPVQPKDVGKNLYEFRDANGTQVIKELIRKSQESGGGFVHYMWMKPTTGTVTDKISYVKAFKPWGWIVGTGFYLDEVEKIITEEKSALKGRMIKYVLEILSLAVILFGLGVILANIVTYLIRKEISNFAKFFKRSSKEYTPIDEEKIALVEFRKMVKYVNRMVKEIHDRQKVLERVNLSLEQKVAKKTRNLKERNSLLAEEKEFSESLVEAQDSFIRHAIHEINTPLAVIMTHIDIYKMKYGENPYLSKIEAASKMIATIYDDLGYMVKRDRQNFEKEMIDLSSYLERRIDFFEEIATGNKQRIVSSIEEGISIYFNETELQRVIDNNLSNAIKYAKKETDILISLVGNREFAIMKFATHSRRIVDTERIFEPFHREEEMKAGFGLGLEIVGSICKKEKIEIIVESDDEITVFEYRFRIWEEG